MIRTYRAGDEVGINILFKTVFGHARSIEEWQWKFKVFSVEEPVIIVAEIDGKIVGHAACLKIPGVFEGQPVLLGERVDIMVHPDYQGQGIYRNIVSLLLQECEAQNIQVLYGFPAEQAKNVFLKAAAGTDLGNIPRFLAVQNPAALLAEKFPIIMPAVRPAARLSRLLQKKQQPFRVHSLPSDGLQLQLLDQLYSAHATKYPLHAIRDASYVKRRFLEHPVKHYEVLLLEQDSGINGYAIVHLERKNRGATIASIVDLWGPQTEDWQTNALRALRASINADAVNMWAIKGSNRYRALKRAGFFHLNSPMPFVVKCFGPEDFALVLQNWHLSQADVDSY